jgi:hypothetical protein
MAAADGHGTACGTFTLLLIGSSACGSDPKAKLIMKQAAIPPL